MGEQSQDEFLNLKEHRDLKQFDMVRTKWSFKNEDLTELPARHEEANAIRMPARTIQKIGSIKFLAVISSLKSSSQARINSAIQVCGIVKAFNYSIEIESVESTC